MSLPQNTFGVEIECYLPVGTSREAAARAISAAGVECVSQRYNHETPTTWKVVTDGSLNDYERGAEFVSPILSGEAGLRSLTTVMDTLINLGATVNKQCGLHCHVGAPHAEMPFFRNLFKLYAHFEPTIDAFMPASRRGSQNLYCRTMTSVAFARIDTAESLDTILRLLTPSTESQRYHKLNFASFRRYRTVEFRQHSGTLEAPKARAWVALCLRMVAAAQAGRINVGTTRTEAQANKGRRNSKARLVGDMMLRPEGVTSAEAIAATGWPSISLPQQANACGLTYTTQRTGRVVRYFANAAQVSTTAAPATLDGLLTTVGATAEEGAYFRARTALFTPTARAA